MPLKRGICAKKRGNQSLDRCPKEPADHDGNEPLFDAGERLTSPTFRAQSSPVGLIDRRAQSRARCFGVVGPKRAT
jgi:hypothetical protein